MCAAAYPATWKQQQYRQYKSRHVVIVSSEVEHVCGCSYSAPPRCQCTRVSRLATYAAVHPATWMQQQYRQYKSRHVVIVSSEVEHVCGCSYSAPPRCQCTRVSRLATYAAVHPATWMQQQYRQYKSRHVVIVSSTSRAFGAAPHNHPEGVSVPGRPIMQSVLLRTLPPATAAAVQAVHTMQDKV
jgi:hypothetical protein